MTSVVYFTGRKACLPITVAKMVFERSDEKTITGEFGCYQLVPREVMNAVDELLDYFLSGDELEGFLEYLESSECDQPSGKEQVQDLRDGVALWSRWMGRSLEMVGEREDERPKP
jgi:hypothetical protein